MGQESLDLNYESCIDDFGWDSKMPRGTSAVEGEESSPRLMCVDDMQDGTPQVYVHFTTDMPDPFKLPDAPISVPSSFQRLDLSKLVNKLLSELAADEWTKSLPFDFLVDGESFLRESLSEYMKRNGITAETPLVIKYQPALREGEETVVPSANDWISDVVYNDEMGLVSESSYDGHFRFYASESASLEEEPFQRGFPSVPALDVSLDQGPLCGSAFLGKSKDKRQACVLFATKGGGLVGVTVSASRETETTKWKVAADFAGFHDGAVAALAANGRPASLVALGGESGIVRLWRVGAAVERSLSREDCELRGDANPKKRKRVGVSAKTAESSGASSRGGVEGECSADDEEAESLNGAGVCFLKSRESVEAHTLPVTSLSFADVSGGTRLFSASLDGEIALWDLEGKAVSSACARALTRRHSPSASSLSLDCQPSSADVVASAHEDCKIRVWDVREEQGVSPASSCELNLRLSFGGRHRRLPSCVRWNPFSPFQLASTGLDGSLFVFDLRSPSQPLTIFNAKVNNRPVRLLSTAWLGRAALISGGSDGRLRINKLVEADATETL